MVFFAVLWPLCRALNGVGFTGGGFANRGLVRFVFEALSSCEAMKLSSEYGRFASKLKYNSM